MVNGFADALRCVLDGRRLAEHLLQEVLAGEDDDEQNNHPELNFLEQVRGAQREEAGEECVGDDGHGGKPQEHAGEVRLEEFSRPHLRPSGEHEHGEVCPQEESGEDEELRGVPVEVVGVELDAAIVSDSAVEAPAETAPAHHPTDAVDERFDHDERRERGQQELTPPEVAAEDEGYRHQEGDLALEEDPRSNDDVAPGWVLDDEHPQAIEEIAHATIIPYHGRHGG